MRDEERHAANRRLFRTHPRKVGALLLMVSALLIYLCYVDPILNAESHKPSVELSMKGAFVGLATGAMSLCYIAGGARFAAIFHPGPTESKVPSYVFAGVVLLISIGAYFALLAHLKTLGYPS